MSKASQMTKTSEVTRAARHLIEAHGELAATVALKRAKNLEGDGAASLVWHEIARAVQALQETIKQRRLVDSAMQAR
jgi:hypothetical protein